MDNYLKLIDDLNEATVEIGADVLLNSLIEKSHDWQTANFESDLMECLKVRLNCSFEQHQRELSFAVRKVNEMFREMRATLIAKE